MKIIKRGSPPEIKYSFECRNCKTQAVAEKDEGRFVDDPRDGGAMVFDCPVCGKECWVNFNKHSGGW